jgi:hypothetical protein
MGKRPRGKELERKNNNKGYSKSNCIWLSHKENSRNTRRKRLLTIDGVTKCLQEWADTYKISEVTISSRLRLGWKIDKLLLKPPRKGEKYAKLRNTYA